MTEKKYLVLKAEERFFVPVFFETFSEADIFKENHFDTIGVYRLTDFEEVCSLKLKGETAL